MFTGIIKGLGQIKAIKGTDCLKLSIDLAQIQPENIAIGDSISVNGACLTLTESGENIGCFDVSSETLSKCLMGHWRLGDWVNLEPALTLQTPLGGHLVSGHIDGCGQVLAIEKEDAFTRMTLSIPAELAGFVAKKGCIAIDGVSLTVNSITDKQPDSSFEVTLIPHTLSHTTLGQLKCDSAVHIEVDQVARYILRFKNFTARQ